jgi:hypothetical protein
MLILNGPTQDYRFGKRQPPSMKFCRCSPSSPVSVGAEHGHAVWSELIQAGNLLSLGQLGQEAALC